MRVTSMKSDKIPAKVVPKKCCTIKKKKMFDLKQPIRDTISETISFVIKGKLTPIKPIFMHKKSDMLDKTKTKNLTCNKMTKNIEGEMKPNKINKKRIRQPAKIKAKVQIEAAKNINPPNKKRAENKISDIFANTPKEVVRRNTSKSAKKKTGIKIDTKKKQKPLEKNTPKAKHLVSKVKKSKTPTKKEKIQNSYREVTPNEIIGDELKKQQTIDELMKQVNEEILEGRKSLKVKKEKLKLKKSELLLDRKQYNIPKLLDDLTDIRKKTNVSSENNALTDSRSDHYERDLPVVLKDVSTKIKLEPLFDKEEIGPIANDNLTDRKSIDEQPVKKTNKKVGEEQTEKILIKEMVSQKVNNKKAHKKLKTKPKITIMKKRVMSSKRQDDENKCKTKLFGFWNGPKRHRVASLNAIAKVHCLYENETRGNMLDIIDEASKLAYAPRKESVQSKIKNENAENDSEASSPLPRRTLRSVPGLRGAGKHWDMHDSSSSSDDFSDNENSKPLVNYVKKETISKQPQKEELTEDKPNMPKKRCRKHTEIMMDLKDMVVRKRMASLNASAILAASYSLEKRQTKATKSDDTDSYDGSSEEYFAASDTELKPEEALKEEDDTNLIEVHSTPNKKVAVILNQDTDVTITGVYVNSTTRSTHHEGYCSIAGMQYRISATSHTQTAATAVATETLLQSSSAPAPEPVSII